MRISDWSSDVCSSDLLVLARHVDDQDAAGHADQRRGKTDAGRQVHRPQHAVHQLVDGGVDLGDGSAAIGRVACRGRGWKYVEITVVTVSSENKIHEDRV